MSLICHFNFIYMLDIIAQCESNCLNISSKFVCLNLLSILCNVRVPLLLEICLRFWLSANLGWLSKSISNYRNCCFLYVQYVVLSCGCICHGRTNMPPFINLSFICHSLYVVFALSLLFLRYNPIRFFPRPVLHVCPRLCYVFCATSPTLMTAKLMLMMMMIV